MDIRCSGSKSSLDLLVLSLRSRDKVSADVRSKLREPRGVPADRVVRTYGHLMHGRFELRPTCDVRNERELRVLKRQRSDTHAR